VAETSGKNYVKTYGTSAAFNHAHQITASSIIGDRDKQEGEMLIALVVDAATSFKQATVQFCLRHSTNS